MTNPTQDYITLKPIAERFKEVAMSISDDEIKSIIKEELREQIRNQVNFGSTIGQWVDDIRDIPSYDYVYARSVNRARQLIEYYEDVLQSAQETNDTEVINVYTIELIDIDHDAGEYVSDGGDYIKLLDWLEETGRNYPIRIHSMNSVGIQNMRRIIKRNGWTEVL